MTGSHEVRGSIPLGSTNFRNKLRASIAGVLYLLCLSCANGWNSPGFICIVPSIMPVFGTSVLNSFRHYPLAYAVLNNQLGPVGQRLTSSDADGDEGSRCGQLHRRRFLALSRSRVLNFL